MSSHRNYYKKSQSKYSVLTEKISPYLLFISRIIIAVVFIFSGFVKAVDPLGFTYKIQDYFTAFGPAFTQLHTAALPLSMLLSTLEIVIGLSLLFSIKIRKTSKLAFIFMLIMTPFTLYIALFNPVSDCGCFGDALKISNWQTFYKNIILLILVIILLLTTTKARPLLTKTYEWIVFVLFGVIAVGISIFSYNHLPIIDFRPYSIGVNIKESMEIPEDAPLDKFETLFIYEKNGIQKEFTLDNYPKDDSTWIFIDQRTNLISKGYVAPIHDFSIVDSQFNDITNDIIESHQNIYLFLMYDLNKTSEEGAKEAEIFYQKHKNSHSKFYALTSASHEQIHAFKQENNISLPFCITDPTTLKTMIRSNPGLIKIKNAVIVGKWHWRDFK